METIIGVALLGFVFLAIVGRRIARIILISGLAGMVLWFGLYTLRSELRSNVTHQQATTALVVPQCPPPAHPGVKMTEGESIAEAYRCWP